MLIGFCIVGTLGIFMVFKSGDKLVINFESRPESVVKPKLDAIVAKCAKMVRTFNVFRIVAR